MSRNLVKILSCISVFFLTLILAWQTAFASGKQEEKRCATIYPIVLVHGMGWKDVEPIVEYFYQIPETLNSEGAQAFSANQLSFAGQKESGESLAVIVGEILASTGKSKVNLIAQSQGGPMVRYMLENLNVATTNGIVPAYEVVASFTSISSPHRGTPICDALVGLLPEGSVANSVVTAALDAVTGFIWTEDTDSERAFLETSEAYMESVFNVENPLVDGSNGGFRNGVYNQCYSGKMTGPTLNALLFVPTALLIKAYDGLGTESDGFVSVPSSKFGVDRGIIEGSWWGGGVDHAYENNLFFGMTPGFDAKEFYINLVEDLKNMGF